MSNAEIASGNGPQDGATTAAQARIIAAALDLFAQHGVAGTSLQMIADQIGNTKAAVYYHYKTKEQIVLAVAEAELARMEATIDDAEQESSWPKARDRLLNNMIDLAVDRRQTVGTILIDPGITRFVPDNKSFRRVMTRMNRLLMGTEAGPDAAIRTATLIAAISGTAISPLVVDFDDDTLRRQLLHLAQGFLDQT